MWRVRIVTNSREMCKLLLLTQVSRLVCRQLSVFKPLSPLRPSARLTRHEYLAPVMWSECYCLEIKFSSCLAQKVQIHFDNNILCFSVLNWKGCSSNEMCRSHFNINMYFLKKTIELHMYNFVSWQRSFLLTAYINFIVRSFYCVIGSEAGLGIIM